MQTSAQRYDELHAEYIIKYKTLDQLFVDIWEESVSNAKGEMLNSAPEKIAKPNKTIETRSLWLRLITFGSFDCVLCPQPDVRQNTTTMNTAQLSCKMSLCAGACRQRRHGRDSVPERTQLNYNKEWSCWILNPTKLKSATIFGLFCQFHPSLTHIWVNFHQVSFFTASATSLVHCLNIIKQQHLLTIMIW